MTYDFGRSEVIATANGFVSNCTVNIARFAFHVHQNLPRKSMFMSNITLFEYQHKQVRTVLVNGEVWFVAADVCSILGIVNASDAIGRLNPAWTMVSEIPTPSRGVQKMVVITEGAVYKLAFRSNKPEAERFTDWIAGEVIPQIRKTGRYVPKYQDVLPLAAHTSIDVQKEMSKSVNSHNYTLGGKQATIDYNIENCKAHTENFPARIKHYGRAIKKLPAKQCTSAKEVLRAIEPETACCMSLADNLVDQGHDQQKVFEVTKTAKNVFKGILELGAKPAELEK